MDDLAIAAHGNLQEIVDNVKHAAKFIKESFERRKLRISSKNCVVSSKPSVAKVICKELIREGIACTHANVARDLGVD